MANVAEQFGWRLKELREAAGLTQNDLCEKAGLTADGLYKLERGKRLPSWETVIALADALGVSLDEFRKEATARPVKVGRPPKKADNAEPIQPRKRGRPRKTVGQ